MRKWQLHNFRKGKSNEVTNWNKLLSSSDAGKQVFYDKMGEHFPHPHQTAKKNLKNCGALIQ